MLRTVLIVDDHAGFRRAARALLQADGFEVIGECPDGEGALNEVARLAPDIVLLDIQLPGLDGFEVADRLTARADAPAVIFISSRDASEYTQALRSSQALGFIHKQRLSGAEIRALAG